MALPEALARHNHVSEREVAHVWPDGQRDDPSWEDCLWCSVVELLNDTYSAALPDSLAFAEKLRAASGEPPTGGSNAWQAQAAIKAVTGLSVPITTGFDGLWSALQPGTAAAIAGSMGAFAYGHRLRRHLPGFAGGHSVYVARVDVLDHVWWCDPLAADTGYNGEWVSKADLKRFVDALPGGGHLYRKLLTGDIDVIPLPVTDMVPVMVSKATKTNFYDLDGKTVVRTANSLTERLSPYGVTAANGEKFRAVLSNKRILLVRGVVSKPLADSSPFTQEQLDAAVLAARKAEYDRIVAATKANLSFPTRP